MDPRPPVPTPRPGSTPGGPRDRIVVAVDDSEASVRALVWAFGKARELGLRVEALTTWPLHGSVFVREVAGHFCEPRWRAREVQAATVARALALVDDAPPYEMRVLNADPVDALTRAGARAVLVVVGTEGPHWPSRSGRRLTERLRHEGPDNLVVIGPEGTEQGASPPTAGPRRRSR
jgi:hypothetical protein